MLCAFQASSLALPGFAGALQHVVVMAIHCWRMQIDLPAVHMIEASPSRSLPKRSQHGKFPSSNDACTVVVSHFSWLQDCHMVLMQKWFEAVQKGQKTYELRALSPFWQSRLQLATHIVFSRGCFSEFFHMHDSLGFLLELIVKSNVTQDLRLQRQQ